MTALLVGESRPQDVRVCFFGDSFVAGVGDSTGLGWVGRVAVAARAAGFRLTAYNLGVRRETSTQVVSRIPSEALPRLTGVEDARIVVSFGVNDATDEGEGPRASVEDGVQSIRVAAELIAPARLLMVGPPAVADDHQNVLIEERDRAFASEAVGLGIRYVPTFRACSEDSTWRHQVEAGDGSHPDAAGYELLAGIIEPVLLEWLAADDV